MEDKYEAIDFQYIIHKVGTLNILLFVLNPWGYGEIVDGFACNHMSKTHFCINDVLLQHIL